MSLLSGEGGLVLPDDVGGVMASWLVCSGINASGDELCDRRARYFGPSSVGNDFSLSNGTHPLGELPTPPLIAGKGSTAFDSRGAVSMVTGSRLWSKSASSIPIAVLENGRTLYGGPSVSSEVFDESGAVTEANVPPVYDYTNSDLAGLGPVLFNGGTQIGYLPTFAEFRAVVTNEAYIEPDGGFALLQGDSFKSNSPQSCVPPPLVPDALFVSSPFATPVDYRFAFDDEVPNFPDAGRFGTFSIEEKALFIQEFVKWVFGGDRGFPKDIIRETANPGIANLVIRKGDFRSVPADQAKGPFSIREASGVVLRPLSYYSSAAESRFARVAAGVPTFPQNKFGIVLQKQDATAADPIVGAGFLKFLGMHEFGHVIGLGDLPPSCSDGTSVMAHGQTKTKHALVPTENDKKGLRAVLHLPQ